MSVTILAEYRRGKKVVLLESAGGEFDREYRVSVFRFYSSLPNAQDAFLKEVPPSSTDYFKDTIAENSKPFPGKKPPKLN